MKNRVSAWLIVVLSVGFPTVAHALDIGGTIAILFKIAAVALMLVLGPILVIVMIYKYVKRKG